MAVLFIPGGRISINPSEVVILEQFLKWFGCLAVLSFGSFVAGRFLPYRWFCAERFPYRSMKFEQEGKLYVRMGLPKWQKKVPDMSRLFPFLMPEKKMLDRTPEGLGTMIAETCIAETVHMALAVLGFAALAFWHSVPAVLLTVLYSLGNLPFVMIQRYNRPRLMRLKRKMETRKEKAECTP